MWREATSKLTCTTTPEQRKDLGAVCSIAAVADLTVAIGTENGRVVLLRLTDMPPPEQSGVAALEPPPADERKRIVMVRALWMCPAGYTQGKGIGKGIVHVSPVLLVS